MIYWINIYNIPEKWGEKVSQDKPLKSPTDVLHAQISVLYTSSGRTTGLLGVCSVKIVTVFSPADLQYWPLSIIRYRVDDLVQGMQVIVFTLKAYCVT